MFRPGIRAVGSMAAVLATCATLVACGSDTSSNAMAAEIDVRKLDAGTYSKFPLDLRDAYTHDLDSARQLAIGRLADQVATGPEIDKRLRYGTGFIPITDKESTTKVLADVNGPVAERNGMMFGFAAGTSDKPSADSTPERADNTFTTLTVMQFPSDEAADRAAREFDETDFAVAPDQNQSITLPAYPRAHSHWRPTVSTVGTTLAHGKYVIYVYAGLPSANINLLTELVTKTYAAQIPLLDALPPLSTEDVVRLPLDADGMLNRTLNPDRLGIPIIKSNESFGLRGYLHRISDQESWKKKMTDMGVDKFSLTKGGNGNTSKVFRTRDSDTAATLRSTLIAESFPTPAERPQNIADSSCGENISPDRADGPFRFRCAVSYRQYVATVDGDQLQDAHQRAAAQYALLANNQ
ncbi:hypothetical protein [Nocardia sp. BMG51109]|uniref:DUF7373 family lipoprotein n=1 Tax=Nocardia sp. BMG51109 TaxID=1056816 RepID=UPI0004B0DE14|nr:hypothetical protein [Nocardia sp. BMG51109]